MRINTTMKTVITISVLSSLCILARGLTDQELALFNGTQISSAVKQGENIVIKSTGIPDHQTGSFPNQANPNSIVMVNHTLTVPKSPTKTSGTPGCLPMGPIGIAINGIPFFNPYTAEGYNAVEGDHKETFDSCEGHPNQPGVYHYHHVPPCISVNDTDKLVGVALDGFPIYGPKRGDGKYMTSADLDICHGTTYQGTYRYYVTSDFPYVIACFSGTAGTATSDSSTMAGGQPSGTPPSGPPPNGQPPGGTGQGGQCFYAFDSVKGQTSFSSVSDLRSNAFYAIVIVLLHSCMYITMYR